MQALAVAWRKVGLRSESSSPDPHNPQFILIILTLCCHSGGRVAVTIDRRQCDIYSLGVVLWEIMARVPPLREMPRLEVMARVCDRPRRELETMPEAAPTMYAECCQSCWLVGPFRPLASEVVEWVKKAERQEVLRAQAEERSLASALAGNRLVV
jgi:hypothetical protein